MNDTRTCKAINCNNSFSPKDTRTIYCSRSCAAKEQALKWKAPERFCLNCSQQLVKPNQKKFCSEDCANEHRSEEASQQLSMMLANNLKTCGKCKQNLSLDHFKIKNPNTGARQAYCVPCNREYQREHYKANRPDYRKKNTAHAKATEETVFTNLLQYLAEHPCSKCGETDPILLEFDHIDPSTKEVHVSQLLSSGKYTWPRVLLEIQKCQVLCVVCHRRKTAEQMGWKKFLIINAKTA